MRKGVDIQMMKMLVVEDEKILREGICKVGNWEEYDIQIVGAAENGQAALQQIQREKPDIILTDVVMPVMDGIELTRTVYEQYSDIRVILLSGHEEFEYVKKAMEYHACDYLLKPARMEKLLEVVLRVKEEILAERKKKADEELLKIKLEKSIPILREHFMNQLLNGRERDEKRIRQQMDYLQVAVDAENIAVMIAELDHKPEEEDLFRISQLQLRELCEEIIGNEYRCIVFDDLKDRVVIVLNYSADISKKDTVTYLQGKAERIQREMKELREESVSFGIGRMINNILYLPKAYREAEKALNFRFFMGNMSTVYIGDMAKDEHGEGLFFAQQEDLLLCIKIGDGTGTDRELRKYFEALENYVSKGQDFIIETIKMFLTYLLIFLKEDGSVFEDDFFTELEELIADMGRRKKLSTLQELERKVSRVLYDIADRINNNRILRNEGIIEKAEKYVKQNMSGDVSLITVADAVFVSPNYLSFLFKEHGENFKDYVVRIKMERAAELMKTEQYNLNQIAQELGYKDGRYFSKVYKKYQEEKQ